VLYCSSRAQSSETHALFRPPNTVNPNQNENPQMKSEQSSALAMCQLKINNEQASRSLSCEPWKIRFFVWMLLAVEGSL
jgi:hypothetical protein